MQQAVIKDAQKPPVAEHRLTLNEVLDWLVEDKWADAAAVETLKKERRYYRGALHPLVTIADQKWKHLAPPHKVLGIEMLTEWLA
jgi:general secretion pathway protein E